MPGVNYVVYGFENNFGSITIQELNTGGKILLQTVWKDKLKTELYMQLVKSILAFTHHLSSIFITKVINFFMVTNFLVDYVDLYINWANNSLFIIFGKLPTLNLPIKSHSSLS